MSDQANQTITALRAGHDELAARVSGMTPDDLTQPSAATEWDISQVLSHLGSGAEIGLATLEAALAGTGNPGPEFNQGVWARWNAMTPSGQAEGFLRASDTLVKRFESLDDTVRAQLRIDLGFLPRPVDVATAAAMRLIEFTYHTWDIEVMSDPAAVLAPAAVEFMIDPLGKLIGFLGRSDALDGRQVTLTVQTAEPDRCFGLDLRDTVTVVDTPAQPAGVLNAPAEAWLRLAAGRLAPQHTPPTMQLTSDTITLDDLRRVFPGF
ncbi:MAG: maleylpyruvate isomerase N-terminal domain-containing protein [Pseudonocardiaceae bacterium]